MWKNLTILDTIFILFITLNFFFSKFILCEFQYASWAFLELRSPCHIPHICMVFHRNDGSLHVGWGSHFLCSIYHKNCRSRGVSLHAHWWCDVAISRFLENVCRICHIQRVLHPHECQQNAHHSHFSGRIVSKSRLLRSQEIAINLIVKNTEFIIHLKTDWKLIFPISL